MNSQIDSSRLRQKIILLDNKRHMLIQQVIRPLPMIGGSLYMMRRTCGNPRCKCARGELHASWYLSQSIKGRTKLSYIGRVIPEWVEKRILRYHKHQKRLAELRKIDAEISRGLKQLRDEKVQRYEQAKKERQ